MTRCSKDLWKAIDKAMQKEAKVKGRGTDPTSWRDPESNVAIQFSPLPLFQMQYTNKPSGIHQVLDFTP